jgi:prepilin-type N-terminal cleavage/methylation domain-containing protein
MRTAQLKNLLKNQKGFTLIELLVVIGILAILLAIVLIAINPARQFGQANNTRRTSDVTQILNAIGAYAADNAGKLPTALTTTAQDASFVCAAIVPTYIPSLPVDPTVNAGAAYTTCPAAAAGATGYTVVKDATNHVTVTATTTDNSAVISATR